MWPFNNASKQEARARGAWGKFPWIGLEVYCERIARPKALYRWAKQLAAMADGGDTPVMISVDKDRPVGEDRTTGKTLWWGNSMRLACPAVPGGIEILRASIESFDRPILDLPQTDSSEKRFDDPAEAMKWCQLRSTWRCQFGATPSPALTEKPVRRPGEPLAAFEGIPAVSGVAFSPDGDRVAFAFYDGSQSGVFVGDVAGGKLLLSISPYELPVNGVAWSPDGRFLAAGFGQRLMGDVGEARVWAAADGAEVAKLDGHRSTVLALAFSPDSTTLATGSADRDVRLWDAASGQLKATLTGHTGPVRDLSFSPDGKVLASASEDNTVRLWDVPAGQPLRTLAGHESYVTGVAFGPDGRLASSSFDKTMRIWQTDGGTELARATTDPTGFSVAYAPDGSIIAYGTNKYWAGGQPTIHLHRPDAAAQPLGSPKKTDLPCNHVVFSPDGKRLAAAFGELDNNSVGALRVWDTQEVLAPS